MKRTPFRLLLAFLALNAFESHAQQNNTNQQNKTAMTTTQPVNKQNQLTAQERTFAIQLLKETASEVNDALKGLGAAQLTFKPAADKWSVEECAKHIAAAEINLWKMAAATLQQAVNPEKRADIKFTDSQLIAAVKDRSHTSKTFEALEPANAPYKTTAEALQSFTENREKLIAFVSSTRQDLRNHVLVLPVGTYDAYQFILLIAAHSNRHWQQIEEVKANLAFPKP